nr:hypothetical protein [Clostridia bacterium]
MQFTYHAYRQLIRSLQDNGYTIASYKDWESSPYCAILRHDIDNDIEKALELAKVEEELGVKSTYFTLVTSDFYNVFSAKSEKLLRAIADCGHDVGLHFDEVRYPDIRTPEDARERILEETRLLSLATGKPVDTVSMHRPSKMMLEADLEIPGMINSYGQVYFKGFKYVSDSRRRWREPVEEIVKAKTYERLHILTHAIWYNENEMDIHDSISAFVNAGNMQRYKAEQENITDLQSIMAETEVR